MDHEVLPLTVTFPVGVSAVVIPLNPLANTNLKTSVIATLKEILGAGYQTFGMQSNASVVIHPSSSPLGIGLTAQFFNNASSTYSDPATSQRNVGHSRRSANRYHLGLARIAHRRGQSRDLSQFGGTIGSLTTGSFRFDLQADEGARLHIDNQLVIDAWTAGSSSVNPIQSAPIALDATTNYPIRVEFYELTNAATIHLRWNPPNGGTYVSIPASAILRPATNLQNWLASYYNNTTFSGTAVYTNFESAVYYDWYSGSPDPAIAVTTYSARWTGQILPEIQSRTRL